MTDKSNSRIWLAISVLLSVTLCTAAPAKTIYVDADAAGANNGSSWDNAYTYLQEALAAAKIAEKPVEIRVAQGVYRPNQGLVAIPEFDWRTMTFQLINGVALKGGYAGLGQPDPNAQNIELYETTLSGDLNGDDVDVADPRYLLIEPTRAENSYHVITGSATGATAILDGFTVTAGNADKGAPSSSGGGMYNHAGSPTIENCIFRTNSANLGGGGMYNYENRPSLTNCIFSNNTAYYEGGGMENCFNASPVLSRCIFSGNSARSGAAVYNLSDCDPILTDCIFSRNIADNDGGGIFNEENCNPSIINCTFNENAA